MAGFDVVLFEVDKAALEGGMARIRGSLDKFVEKNTLSSADREGTLGRLEQTTNLEDLKRSDLVIEAITENMPAKKEKASGSNPLVTAGTTCASPSPGPVARLPMKPSI